HLCRLGRAGFAKPDQLDELFLVEDVLTGGDLQGLPGSGVPEELQTLIRSEGVGCEEGRGGRRPGGLGHRPDREGAVGFELATLDAQAAGRPGPPEDADAVLGHKMAVLQDHLLSGRADGGVAPAGRHPAMRERQPSLGADNYTARQEVRFRYTLADLDAP